VLTDLGIVSIGGAGVALSRGPEAFAGAVNRAHGLGRDLTLAIRKEKQFPEGEARVRERKEMFKNLVGASRDAWPYQYEVWKKRGELD